MVTRPTGVRRWSLVLVAAAIAVGAFVRFAWLGSQSFDEDETVTVWLMHHSLDGMLDTIPRTESTPPLFYVLEWCWTQLFGTGAVALRSLSGLLGVAAIPAAVLAVRELSPVRRAQPLVAALAALSPALVWYSQEGRAYALLVLTTIVSLIFFARVLKRAPASGADLVGWAVAAAAALTSHYFALFVVLPQAAWLLLRARPWQRVLFAVAAVGVVGAALIPLALRQHASGGSDWIGEIGLVDRLKDVPPQLLLGEGRPFQHWFFGAVAGAAALPVVVALVLRRPGERRVLLVLLGIAVCGVGLPALVDLAGTHILLDRNALAVTALLLVAFAIAMARTRALGVAAAILVCGLFAWDLGMVVTNPRMQREDWRDAARALGPAPVTRAIVFGPNASNPKPAPPLVPFQAVYLPSMLTMPNAGYAVSEIDELDVRDDLSDTSPPPDPVSPGRRYRLVGRVVRNTFALYRYASARPVHVTPDGLISRDLLSNRDEGDQLIGLQLGPGARQR